ncbi:hypothetical protein ANCDUO_13155 [Ancylostoma duodenale]|uniref:Uncharacterized protein n=1 Tax=Ancylostoma duodenale TaxID=51022 RepID=A0A0C2GCP7_9BILA|nr:hypothetical protein ANCDUO_13155 [Ancylostoma duodenale]
MSLIDAYPTQYVIPVNTLPVSLISPICVFLFACVNINSAQPEFDGFPDYGPVQHVIVGSRNFCRLAHLEEIPPPQPPPPTPPPQLVLEPPTAPPPLFNSPEIQRVVTSLNTRTTAFSRPGQGYENVITILRALMEKKSRVAYRRSRIIYRRVGHSRVFKPYIARIPFKVE